MATVWKFYIQTGKSNISRICTRRKYL